MKTKICTGGDLLGDVFYEIKEFCEKAVEELKEDKRDVKKTIRNMTTDGWWYKPETLLHKLYLGDRRINMLTMVYDGDELIGISGTEELDERTLILAKRFYILKKYRLDFIFSNHMIKDQVRWAMVSGYEEVVITFNEYRKKLADAFKRVIKGKGWGTNHSHYLRSFKYDGKRRICGVDQYVFSFDIMEFFSGT